MLGRGGVLRAALLLGLTLIVLISVFLRRGSRVLGALEHRQAEADPHAREPRDQQRVGHLVRLLCARTGGETARTCGETVGPSLTRLDGGREGTGGGGGWYLCGTGS